MPDDWSKGIEDEPPEVLERPYLAAAGRLVKMKGFQRLIPLMSYLPEVDLRIAGTGPYEAELKALAAGLPNVRFEGLLGGAALARLFRSARAVVVPSLFPETFGYVVLEAFAVGTPVVVHEGGGALYETGFLSGGGLALSHGHRAFDCAAADGARSSSARRPGSTRVCSAHGRMVGIGASRTVFRLARRRPSGPRALALPAATRSGPPHPE